MRIQIKSSLQLGSYVLERRSGVCSRGARTILINSFLRPALCYVYTDVFISTTPVYMRDLSFSGFAIHQTDILERFAVDKAGQWQSQVKFEPMLH